MSWQHFLNFAVFVPIHYVVLNVREHLEAHGKEVTAAEHEDQNLCYSEEESCMQNSINLDAVFHLAMGCLWVVGDKFFKFVRLQ